jgi:LmbE family N-acetylglucosaminyl deacetylase
MYSERMKVLAIGAHPDDIELGAGGTVARHVKEGDEVHFLVLTFGEKTEKKENRKLEAEESARALKVKSLSFGDIEDTKVSEGIDTINIIEDAINRIKPNRVYTQCLKDRHQDHRNTAYASFSAARKVAEVFSYESPDSYPDFVPQYYIQISENMMNTKIKALQNYNTQRNKPFLEAEAIKGLAMFRGYQVGILYAEAFEVARVVKL